MPIYEQIQEVYKTNQRRAGAESRNPYNTFDMRSGVSDPKLIIQPALPNALESESNQTPTDPPSSVKPSQKRRVCYCTKRGVGSLSSLKPLISEEMLQASASLWTYSVTLMFACVNERYPNFVQFTYMQVIELLLHIRNEECQIEAVFEFAG